MSNGCAAPTYSAPPTTTEQQRPPRSADSGRSRDRDQTAQFIGLRMSLKPIDL
jgi:hypothetical protein